MKPPASRARRIVKEGIDALWAFAGFAVCAAWWTGWMVKDRYPALIWLYYLPALAMAAGGFIWLFLTLRHRFRILQLFVFATVLFALVKLLVIDHRWHRPPVTLPQNNIRILHWNTARGVLGVESILRTVVDDNPDIVMFSEPPRQTEGAEIAFHALGMRHVFTDAGMSLASHYPITYLGNIILPAGAGWHALVETTYGPVEFAAIDIVSRPKMDRRPAMRALTRWLDERTNHFPLVVMGDFNTPHDAASIRPLRARLNYAYEKRGRGWPYTWPVPVPLYAIDHTWVSRDITIQDMHFKTARLSDHKRQIVDITFPDRRPRRIAPAGEP